MLSRKKSLLVSALLLLPFIALANQGTHYYDTVNEAKNMVTQSLANPNITHFNVNEYCIDDACREAIANPEQTQYFGNDDKMVSDGQAELNRDENALNLQEGFSDRPKHELDLNDPAYQRAQGYMDDAYNISHGISSKYHDCESGERCEASTATKSCTISTNLPVLCHVVPNIATNDDRESKQYAFKTNSSLDNYTSNVLTNDSRTVSRVSMNGTYYNILTVDIGMAPAVDFPLFSDDSVIGRFPVTYIGKDGKYVQIFDVNSSIDYNGEIKSLILGSRLRFDGVITLTFGSKTADIDYVNSCNALLPECQQVSKQCIEGKETRIIDGVSITLDCWNEQLTYQCNMPNTCDSLSDCTKQTTTCDTELEGVCISQTEQRLCETKECEDIGLICGEQSFCLDGDCYEGEGEENPNFSTAVSGLAGAAEAAESFDADSLKIFTGLAVGCSKKAAGISNCCKDSGWGNDIGLADCSEEEIGLIEAIKSDLTIYLGEYCAESVLGVCIRKKKSYCQFDSKMARIIQEQGRVQLDVGFGSAKAPNCTGITPEQLQLVDFSQIDFSDFYNDLDAGLALPDMDEVTDRIQDKYKDH